MNTHKQQATETRIVSLKPGMYIVRFNAIPTLGEGAILSVAPSDGAVELDFFCSEGIKNNTLFNQSDIIVVRCSGGEGNLLITSMCSSGRPVGTRVDMIAGAVNRPGADVTGLAAPQPHAQVAGAQPAPQQVGYGGVTGQTAAPQAASPLNLIGHIEQQGDVQGQPGGWLGDPQSSRRLEGFTIEWPNRPGDVDIACSVVIAGLGRSPAVLSGGFCGSRQRAAAINALTVSLVGKNAAAYELRLEAVFAGCPPQKLRSGVEVRGIAGREALVALRGLVTPKSL